MERHGRPNGTDFVGGTDTDLDGQHKEEGRILKKETSSAEELPSYRELSGDREEAENPKRFEYNRKN
jgi:hypothetical protein